ncbi:hypothetical protein A0H81_05757 [Grifola frondosa]|uniref:Uncharacterized protein n=1 Tax=Grifola frondosa TaxID=5627 RepID=A0A1C7MDD1_GRIFR|nr:hypothetical protein A0H81_05757 [Grifola frondosa]
MTDSGVNYITEPTHLPILTKFPPPLTNGYAVHQERLDHDRNDAFRQLMKPNMLEVTYGDLAMSMLRRDQPNMYAYNHNRTLFASAWLDEVEKVCAVPTAGPSWSTFPSSHAAPEVGALV